MEPQTSTGVSQTDAFSTNDLSFAAYMIMRGAQLLSAKRFGKSYKFTLKLTVANAQELKIAYINSESARFDAAVRDLKTILFGGDN
jgi:hypothetical protein